MRHAVPLFAMGDGRGRGYVKTDLFQNTCVYPTLCRLIGVEPSPCDGEPVGDLLAE